ncbi:MAG: TRAP transporter large permease subunit [Clostridiales bacterium]|nr:TRAP transporter large permease subunit [Clostridiales bacterium]
MDAKTLALILFLATYICLLIFTKVRAFIALGSALIFVILGLVDILPTYDYLGEIDWNVIMMIAGTMGVVSLFIESKMPSKLADIIIDKTPNVKWAMVSLALFAGIISAFVDNVATVLMVAPVALTIAKKLKMSPVPSVIAIAISSNLQGAATLVGDTTSILLGGEANMNFLEFFWYKGKPSIFWVVELGALATIFILLWLFREYKQPVKAMDKTEVTDYFPTVLLTGIIVLLILASFIEKKPDTTNGLICMGLLIIGLIRKFIKTKDKNTLTNVLKDIDYTTIGLLAGLFVLIGGIKTVGVIDDIGALFVKVGGDNLFVIYTLIVWASVAISAVIDNIPYVATMLPVVSSIASSMGIDPTILYFGLLVGSTLGGNITPIGASANIAGIGILRKEGHEVSTKEFMKISVPFTLTAVITGYVLIWLIWA